MDDVRALRYSPADVLAALSCPPEHADVIRLPASGARSRKALRTLLGRSTVRLRGLVIAVARVRSQSDVAGGDPGTSPQLVCEVVATRTRKTPSLISHFSPVQFG